jgi:hypothetical protein
MVRYQKKGEKIKVAVVWFWDMASQIFPGWRDGLRAATEELRKEHQVDWFLDKKVPPTDDYDFILLWSDSNCPFIYELWKYDCPKGLLYGSTFEPNWDNFTKFEVIFTESPRITGIVKSNGFHTIQAFGTDTDFYKPYKGDKDIEYFYPATFSPWKRQSDIAYLGDKLWCVGYMQPDGGNEYNACLKTGVHLIPDNLPADEILRLYDRSKSVIIPAYYGSERTVLESMACGLWPTLTHPEVNLNAQSFIDEYVEAKNKKKSLKPRDFIMSKYTHKHYAQQLLKGMNG